MSIPVDTGTVTGATDKPETIKPKATSTMTPKVAVGLGALDREFLSRVVVWPTGDDVGYINVHWRFPKQGAVAKNDGIYDPKDMIMTGLPTRSVDEFVNKVEWLLSLNQRNDIYICKSLQSQRK